MTSFNLKTSLKASSPNAVAWGVRAAVGFEGHNSAHSVWTPSLAPPQPLVVPPGLCPLPLGPQDTVVCGQGCSEENSPPSCTASPSWPHAFHREGVTQLSSARSV